MRPFLQASVLLACFAAPLCAQPSAAFVENRGQWDARAKYLLQCGTVNFWITDSGMVYDMFRIAGGEAHAPGALVPARSFHTPSGKGHPAPLRDGAVISCSFLHTVGPHAIASDPDPGRTNYFIGNDSTRWVHGVRSFERATIEHLYNGIDAIFTIDRGVPRYDLVLEPGADVSQVQMEMNGADSIVLQGDGTLSIRTSLGTIEERELAAYQERNGTREPVACAFRLDGNRVSFQLGPYDPTRPVTIDPLLYSSRFGFGSEAFGLAVDRAGDAYVTGWAGSTSFPVTPGAYQNKAGGANTFILKLNPSGSALVYSTYLGGSSSYFWGDEGIAIAIDSAGDAYVTGNTTSTDFPVTSNAFQRASKGTTPGYVNAFAAKLDSDGSHLLYSTYLGGSDGDFDGYGESGSAIAVDSAGEAIVFGTTSSSDFPVTKGAFQTKNGAFTYNFESIGCASTFVTKFNARGTGLIYSTYLGGSKLVLPNPYPIVMNEAAGMALDRAGNVFLVGSTNAADFPVTPGAIQPAIHSDTEFNAFVAELNPSGSALEYATYLGGSRNDVGTGIAIDSAGDMFVTGVTTSPDFRTSSGAFQPSLLERPNAFVTKLSADGRAVLYSTFIGNSEFDSFSGFQGQYGGTAIAVDTAGEAFVTGTTASSDFPTLPGAIQKTNHGRTEAFVAELDPNGASLVYATYLGGAGDERPNAIALGTRHSVYLAGMTTSTDFPTTRDAFQAPFLDSLSATFVAMLSPVTRFLSVDSTLRDLGTGSLCRTADTAIVLINGGDDTIAIKSIALSGTHFSFLKNPTRSLLLPGQADTVILAYDPSLGRDTAYLTVLSDAANDSVLTVPIAAETHAAPEFHLHAIVTHTAASQNGTVSLGLYPDTAVSNVDLHSVQATVSYNSDLLSELSATSPLAFWESAHSQGSMTWDSLEYSGTNISLDPQVPIAQFVFRTAVADSLSTRITVSDPVLNGSDPTFAACVLSAGGDSTSFSLAPACGDSLLMEALRGHLAIQIEQVYPDRNDIEIAFRSYLSLGNSVPAVEIVDALGRTVPAAIEREGIGKLKIDTRTLASGLYTVLLRAGGTEAAARFPVVR